MSNGDFKEGISSRVKKLPMSAIRILSDAARSEEVIRLQAGDPDFNTPAHIVSAMRQAVDSGTTHYTSSAGLLELREAIGQKLRSENGLSYEPQEEIAVTNGGTGALSLTILATVDDGDEVLVPDPGWPNYIPMILSAGGKPVPYKLLRKNDFLPNLDEVAAAVTPKTKLMIVNSPSNPTGNVFPKETLEGLAELANRKRFYLVSDEVYEKIVYEDAKHISMATIGDAWERTLTVNSFSKTYAMTGWRVGYVAGPRHIVSAVAALNSAINSCPSSVSQVAALAALKGPQHIVDEMVSEYKKRRNYFIGALNEMPDVWAFRPKGAFYAFADFSKINPSSTEFTKTLLESAKVAAVPGLAFGANGEGYIRFSFASSMAELQQAAKRMTDALRRSRI
jgi:aminotransferase